MKQLKQNIINIYGKAGERWIANLPMTISALTAYWSLKEVTPVDNMTFNYVAKATTQTGEPVVLKISCDEKTILAEMQALQYFKGNGSILLISHHPQYNALLLQQAIPGTTLKSLYLSQMTYVMDCYVATMKELHSKHLPRQHHFSHINDWLIAIDKLSTEACPAHLIKHAIALKNKLLSSTKEEVFLHGDLHHDNILENKGHWLAIDPMGIVGEPAFEIAAFDFMYINELANSRDIKAIFESRVQLLAEKAMLNKERIKDWVFVRLILMAAWQVGDNSDPSWSIKLAEQLI